MTPKKKAAKKAIAVKKTGDLVPAPAPTTTPPAGPKPIQVVVVCRTFRDSEFLEAMIESLYHNVAAIVFVHAGTSSIGEIGNTSKPVVDLWAAKRDDQTKIHQIDMSEGDMDAQLDHAFSYIDIHFPEHTHKMMMDLDMVWGRDDLNKAITHLRDNPDTGHFTCQAHNYIKSPLFRVFPIDAPRLTMIVKAGRDYAELDDALFMENVVVHRFSGVSKSLDSLLRKLRRQSQTEDEPLLDEQEWIETVWNQLPDAKNVHWFKRYAEDWKGVERVTLLDIPITCRDKPFVLAFDTHVSTVTAPKAAPAPKRAPGLLHAAALGPSATPTGPREHVGLKKVHKYEVKHHNGSTCIAALVDANYLAYAPLFLHSCRHAYPEYDAKVFVRGEVPADIAALPLSGGKILPYKGMEFPEGGYTTAAMRFVVLEDELKDYDFVLIQDIDMLMYREDLSAVDQHMMHMVTDGTICYENAITAWRGDNPRLPGVHFLTKTWWEATRDAREKEARILAETGATEWSYDEFMLGRIVKDSGLPLPPSSGLKLWRHHGVHLGDWRINQNRKGFLKRPNAWEGMHIQSLLADAVFMDMAKVCGQYISLIPEVISKWPLLFRG